MLNEAALNVFVGVSIRNKSLTNIKVAEILSLAINELHANRIHFLIADEIELLNRRVFSRGSADKLNREVRREAIALEATIRNGIEQIRHPRVNISIGFWKNILDHGYWSLYIEVFSLFIESEQLRKDIANITQDFVARRGRKATSSELNFLSQYVLYELPTVIDGIRLNGRLYQTMVYPVLGTEAIDNIAARLVNGEYGSFDSAEPRCRVHRLPAN